jgi:hypothetical protein
MSDINHWDEYLDFEAEEIENNRRKEEKKQKQKQKQKQKDIDYLSAAKNNNRKFSY